MIYSISNLSLHRRKGILTFLFSLLCLLSLQKSSAYSLDSKNLHGDNDNEMEKLNEYSFHAREVETLLDCETENLNECVEWGLKCSKATEDGVCIDVLEENGCLEILIERVTCNVDSDDEDDHDERNLKEIEKINNHRMLHVHERKIVETYTKWGFKLFGKFLLFDYESYTKTTYEPIPHTHGNPDPHFSTWHGSNYDYHGECDLVYTKCNNFNHGKGLHLHVRTKHVEPKLWSTFSNIALRIGEDVFELTEDGDYYVNAEKNPSLPMMLSGEHEVSKGIFEHNDKELTAYDIDLMNGSYLKIGFFNAKYLFFEINPILGTDQFSDCVGLSSSWSQIYKPHNEEHEILIGRSGKRYMNGIEAPDFAEEWQVRPEEDGMLFQTKDGPQYPQQCNRSPFDVRTGRRHLEELYNQDGGEHHRRAMDACAHHSKEAHYENCVFDLLVTGDMDFANAPWHE